MNKLTEVETRKFREIQQSKLPQNFGYTLNKTTTSCQYRPITDEFETGSRIAQAIILLGGIPCVEYY
jgi:hypothetical protein